MQRKKITNIDKFVTIDTQKIILTFEPDLGRFDEIMLSFVLLTNSRFNRKIEDHSNSNFRLFAVRNSHESALKLKDDPDPKVSDAAVKRLEHELELEYMRLDIGGY